jgi:predicted MFS family arabinose efflux permease
MPNPSRSTDDYGDSQNVRLFNKHFGLLVLCHFLQALGWSSMLLLPKYFQQLGENSESIGILMASASLGGLLVRPLIGWALDCYGKRLVLTLGSVCLAAGMWTLSVHAPTYGPLLAGRILVGIGAGTLFTGYFAFVAVHIPSARRTEGLALFGISGILPMALNALTGEISSDPNFVQQLFPVLTLPIIISGALIWWVPEHNSSQPTQQTTHIFKFGDLFTRKLWSVWIATLIFSTQVAAFMAFATLCAPPQEQAASQHIWLYYAMGAVSVRLFAAKWPDRLGTHNFVAPSLAAYCIGFLLLVDGTTSTAYCFAGLFAGFGHGYCFPVLTSQVIQRIESHATSRGLALFTALWEITSLIATAPLGAFADAYGLNSMCGLVVVFSVVLLCLWTVAEHRFGDTPEQKLFSPTNHHS